LNRPKAFSAYKTIATIAIAKSITIWESPSATRLDAVNKLVSARNQKILATIAKNDSSEYVRKSAINKLDPEKGKQMFEKLLGSLSEGYELPAEFNLQNVKRK